MDTTASSERWNWKEIKIRSPCLSNVSVFASRCLENPRNASVKMAGVPAEVWTEYFRNASLERYLYASPLGSSFETRHLNNSGSLHIYIYIRVYCHAYVWLWTWCGLDIGFIDHLQVVTIDNYNSLTESHTPDITVTAAHSITSSLQGSRPDF
jgi:hypothetical protein